MTTNEKSYSTTYILRNYLFLITYKMQIQGNTIVYRVKIIESCTSDLSRRDYWCFAIARYRFQELFSRLQRSCTTMMTMFWRRKVEANNLRALLLDIKEEAKEKDRELQCNELSFLPATGWPLRPALIVRYQKALTDMCAQLINEQITLYSRLQWCILRLNPSILTESNAICTLIKEMNVTTERLPKQVMNRNYFFRNENKRSYKDSSKYMYIEILKAY